VAVLTLHRPHAVSCEPRLGIADCSRTVDGSLTAQLLEHLGGTGKSVTRLANGDVEDELLDAQLTHGVGSLLGGTLANDIGAVGLLLGGLSNGLHTEGC
jgi:hypothetical protein